MSACAPVVDFAKAYAQMGISEHIISLHSTSLAEIVSKSINICCEPFSSLQPTWCSIHFLPHSFLFFKLSPSFELSPRFELSPSLVYHLQAVFPLGTTCLELGSFPLLLFVFFYHFFLHQAAFSPLDADIFLSSSTHPVIVGGPGHYSALCWTNHLLF